MFSWSFNNLFTNRRDAQKGKFYKYTKLFYEFQSTIWHQYYQNAVLHTAKFPTLKFSFSFLNKFWYTFDKFLVLHIKYIPILMGIKHFI